MVGPWSESLLMHYYYRTIIINLGLYIKLKKLLSNFVHFCPILPLFLGVGQNSTKKAGQNWTKLDCPPEWLCWRPCCTFSGIDYSLLYHPLPENGPISAYQNNQTILSRCHDTITMIVLRRIQLSAANWQGRREGGKTLPALPIKR